VRNERIDQEVGSLGGLDQHGGVAKPRDARCGRFAHGTSAKKQLVAGSRQLFLLDAKLQLPRLQFRQPSGCRQRGIALLHCHRQLHALPLAPVVVDYQMIEIIPDFLICLSWVMSSIPSTSAVAPINRS
jgi:hypothetical protein